MDSFFHYLADDPEAEVWGVYVPTCGYQHIYPGAQYPLEGHPDTHDFQQAMGRTLPGCYLVYVPTGKGTLETKSGKWEVNSGDVMLLYPGEWHKYKPDEDTGWEEYWMGIRGEVLSNKILKDLFPNNTSYVKQMGYQDELIFLFNQSIKLVKRNSPGFRKILAGIVLQLVAYVISYENQETGNREEELCKKIIDFIRENLNTEVDFKKLASEHHLSYNRFRTVFKNNTGVSLQQYLIQERLEHAKRLMVNTTLSLKEISAKTGFNSLFYFSKVFKNKMGYSPGQIRRKP
ncbi:AraC family transcriptional regulator [Winogradskyella psychrotolerans]|uniref:AraC family transcriptional regulator n=1 Tax=Winogradskyella TaxID=286104 RepID=UPI000E250F94|nr:MULTISPECIES: AraC family transcriptional regulator [Winogradskyella]MBU2921573.1 AraC family transcriptional regulator [Winogradskyella psychrotolerans]REG89434.1 AraC-like DNA-binding protein [Winogradskyella sediminis]